MRDERGAALPLVLVMLALLGLSLASAVALGQTGSIATRSNAIQREQRSVAVSTALGGALRDLTPVSGRLLGVDPALDPAGSCVHALGPYRTADGRTIAVACAEGPGSGWTTSQSSLVLTGTGSDAGATCIASGGCVTGEDGGLRLTSNDPLNLSGGLVNLAGAWSGKATKTMLNLLGSPRAVLQPALGTGAEQCPAVVRNGADYAFDADPRCECPSMTDAGGACSTRAFTALRDAVAAFVAASGARVAADVPSATSAVVPKCSDAPSRLNASDEHSPWVLRITGGRIGPTEMLALNQLTDKQSGCVGDGGPSSPALVLTGVLRFGSATSGDAMTPGSAPTTANTWTIASRDALVIGGVPVVDDEEIVDCDRTAPGTHLEMSGASYLRITSGSVSLCPLHADGAVLSAPTAAAQAGFVWSGARNAAVLGTAYGMSGGEMLRMHGLLFAPSAWAEFASQAKSTNIVLDAGVVLRALTLTSNPSASVQGDIAMPSPTGSADRTVQLRIRDLTRARDLGLVELVIHATSASAPAAGYTVHVWRALW